MIEIMPVSSISNIFYGFFLYLKTNIMEKKFNLVQEATIHATKTCLFSTGSDCSRILSWKLHLTFE